jgi:hypothetical protein
MAISQPAVSGDISSTVRTALAKAESYCAKYRPWDNRLLILSIVCGALATVLAGGAVAGGKPAIDAFGGWRILCSIVAVVTASGTVAGTLHKGLQITTKVGSAEQCIVSLRSLEATIAAGLIPTDQALAEYRRISEEHAGCLI